jgi:hypothetical protein
MSACIPPIDVACDAVPGPVGGGYAPYLSRWRGQLSSGPSLRPGGCSRSSCRPRAVRVSVRLPAHAGSAALGPTRLGPARNSQAFAVATRRITASRLVQLRRSCAIALTAA